MTRTRDFAFHHIRDVVVDAHGKEIHRTCSRCGLVDPPVGSECPTALRLRLDRANGRLTAARNDARRVAVRFCACPVGDALMAGSSLKPDYACSRCASTGYRKVRPDALLPEELRADLRAKSVPVRALPPVPRECPECHHKYTGTATCPLEQFHEATS